MTEPYKETNRFDAIDNEGERYSVIELRRFTFRRAKRLALLNGENVNRLKDGTFQIFETGKILKKLG